MSFIRRFRPIFILWTKRFPNAPQWTRVLTSNFVSIPVDSVVFSVLAFTLLPSLFGAESMPFMTAVARVASGQIIFKRQFVSRFGT